MTDYSLLFWGPLVSAAIWFGVSAYQISQERYRTWTEVFLLAMSITVGAYALSDALFFSSSTSADARILAIASLASLTLAAVFVFLYAVTLYNRFRRVLLLAAIPAAILILLIPEMLLDLQPLAGSGAPYVPEYNLPRFVLWAAVVLILVAVGVVYIYRTFSEVRKQTPALAKRMGAILAALLVAVLLGIATNLALGLLNIVLPPLFSTTLALPGVLLFLAVSPTSVRRFNQVLLRRKAADFTVRAAFLTYSDGTLIGSKVQSGEHMVDQDLFGATLDVIQNFMHTSFPSLRGKWIRSIRHGDHTLLMERGNRVLLTLVLEGEENDQLRRYMLERVRAFEDRNEDALAHWRGVATDAAGTDELLEAILTRAYA